MAEPVVSLQGNSAASSADAARPKNEQRCQRIFGELRFRAPAAPNCYRTRQIGYRAVPNYNTACRRVVTDEILGENEISLPPVSSVPTRHFSWPNGDLISRVFRQYSVERIVLVALSLLSIGEERSRKMIKIVAHRSEIAVQLPCS